MRVGFSVTIISAGMAMNQTSDNLDQTGGPRFRDRVTVSLSHDICAVFKPQYCYDGILMEAGGVLQQQQQE